MSDRMDPAAAGSLALEDQGATAANDQRPLGSAPFTLDGALMSEEHLMLDEEDAEEDGSPEGEAEGVHGGQEASEALPDPLDQEVLGTEYTLEEAMASGLVPFPPLLT